MSQKPQQPNCPKLAELYKKLQTLKSSFEADLVHAQTTIKAKDIKGANTAITKAKTQRQEMEKIIYEIREAIIPLDKLMNFNEQYETQKSVLTELGDLVKLSNGQLGIKGIDPTDPLNPAKTKDYVFPSKEAIRKRFLANRELYQLKINQGFTRLLITPFALPLEKMADKYGKELVKKFQANDNQLYSAGSDPYNSNIKLEDLTTLELDINQSIWVYDDLKEADINGNLKYYPNQFIRATEKNNCGGHTKLDILKDLGSPFPGFKITLIPQNPIITNSDDFKNLHEALSLTQDTDKKSIYYGTCGQTPEDALNLHRQTLHLTNQVLGDWKENDKGNYCLGAYLDGSDDVPSLHWNRDDRQAFLGGNYPGDHLSSFGFRPAVGVL